MASGLTLPAAMTLVVLATAGALAQSPWPAPTQPQTAPTRPSSPQPSSAAPAAPAPQAPAAAPAPQAPATQAAPAWPTAPARPVFGASPQQQQQQGGGRNCMAEFMPLKEDAEKKAGAIRAAAPRKNQQEMCSAFKSFAAAEAKMLKFVEDHGVECRVPPEAPKTMKANHAKTVEVRNKICSAPAQAGPPPPSLSDALGTSRIPDPTAPARRGGGTFDTLSGSSLGR